MDLAEEVYESLLGERIEPIPGVGNAFGNGMDCTQWYGEMLEAYERLRIRLDVQDEDVDVETIIDNLLMIQRWLCIEMFRLGAKLDH